MNSIKKNYLYNSFYQVLIIIIPLITTPYIARILGAENIGIYSYSYSVAQYYVLFIMLGLNNYGNRAVASIKDDKNELSKTFWNIYAMQFSLGIVVSIIYFIYCFFLARNVLASLIMSIYVISAFFDINWFFFGMEKFKLTVLRNTLIRIATTISIFIFVKQADDVYKYCLIMVVGIFLSQVVLWAYVKKMVDFVRPTFKEIKVHIKPNFVLFLTVIAVSLFKIMDKIMLGKMTNTQEVGFYESSERVISIPTAFITSLGIVMLPRMTNLLANNSKDSNNLLYKSVLLAMFLSSSMGFGIMAVSKVFVPIFYGRGFETCIYLFIILAPSCLFLAFGNVIRTQYLLPNRLDHIYVISAFIGAGINIIINLILIPILGSVGAAIGTLFAEAGVCIYQAYKVSIFIPVGNYFLKSLPFIFSGFIMFISVYFMSGFMSNSVISLFALIFSGVAIYFIIFGIIFYTYKLIFKKRII